MSTSRSGCRAKAIPLTLGGTWTVFYETASGYGYRGISLTREQAESLAEDMREGRVSP